MNRAAPAVLLIAAVVIVAGCGAARVGPIARTSSHPSPKMQAPQVEVVAYSSGDVRVCPPYAMAVAATGPVSGWGKPQPPFCKDGLRATGVDTRLLTAHAKGVSWGYLHLVGRLDGGIFHVTSQGHSRVTPNLPSTFNAPIPCPAPSGGWRFAMPTQQQNAVVDHYYALAHHHDLVSVAMWHDASILLVTSSHPSRTRKVLGAYWPRQLCVRKARYSRATLTREQHRMEALLGAANRPGGSKYGWPTGAGGTTVNRRGQAMTTLEVLIVTPTLRDYLRRQPPGLVQVASTFVPVR